MTPQSDYSQSKSRSIVCLSLILCGIIFPVLSLNIGMIPWHDEFYQILCIHDYKNVPFAALTMFTGNIWMRVTGMDSVLGFRILAYICYTIAIGLSCHYLYRQTGRMLYASAAFFCLQLCNAIYVATSYEWDTLSTLNLTISCIFALKYQSDKSVKSLVGFGVFSACAVFSRIPNISVIIIALILIFINRCDAKTKAMHLASYILSVAFTSLILILVIWGSIQAYIESWNPDNIISNHSNFISLLLGQAISQLPVNIRYLLMWVGCFATVYYIVKVSKSAKTRALCLFGLLAVLVSVIVLVRFTTTDTHKFNIEIFYFSVFIIPLISIYKKQDIRQAVIYSLILFAFAMVTYGGTDAGLHKILSVPLIPLALAFLFRFRSDALKYFYMLLGAMTVVLFPVILSKDPYTREFRPAYKAAYQNIPRLKGIKDSGVRAAEIQEIYSWAKPIKDNNQHILFIGKNRYLLDYILCNNKDNIDRYPIQRFHDEPGEASVIERIVKISDNFDYIYINEPLPDSISKQISSLLANKGFSLYLSNENYSVWQKNE